LDPLHAFELFLEPGDLQISLLHLVLQLHLPGECGLVPELGSQLLVLFPVESELRVDALITSMGVDAQLALQGRWRSGRRLAVFNVLLQLQDLEVRLPLLDQRLIQGLRKLQALIFQRIYLPLKLGDELILLIVLGGEGLGCLHLDLHLSVDLVNGLGPATCRLLLFLLILLKNIHSDLGCPNELINLRELLQSLLLSHLLFLRSIGF